MDWESTNYTPRRLLSSSNSVSQPINPMTAGQQYQCNGLTVICQKSESPKSNMLQIESPNGNIQGSAEVMTQLNTPNTELRENRKRRLSDDSQSDDESGSDEQPITGNTLEDMRRELEEKRAILNTLDIERHSKCQELLDQHYRELESRATHFAVHPVPTAENVEHTARKLERELIDARDQSIRYFEEHPRLDVCRMATESFTESNGQCDTMLEQCKDTTKRYQEYIDAIPYGTVYYQVADYDDKQMKAVNKLYHDKDSKKKGILLFDENDVDKNRDSKEERKYPIANEKSATIAMYENSIGRRTDCTFTFGITTVFIEAVDNPAAVCPMETCYKRLIDGQFQDLWDRFLSKGYDVVVPNIGLGQTRNTLPDEYSKYIQDKLTSLEEKTGRASKKLEKDEQYGVDPPQPVAVGVSQQPTQPIISVSLHPQSQISTPSSNEAEPGGSAPSMISSPQITPPAEITPPPSEPTFRFEFPPPPAYSSRFDRPSRIGPPPILPPDPSVVGPVLPAPAAQEPAWCPFTAAPWIPAGTLINLVHGHNRNLFVVGIRFTVTSMNIGISLDFNGNGLPSRDTFSGGFVLRDEFTYPIVRNSFQALGGAQEEIVFVIEYKLDEAVAESHVIRITRQEHISGIDYKFPRKVNCAAEPILTMAPM